MTIYTVNHIAFLLYYIILYYIILYYIILYMYILGLSAVTSCHIHRKRRSNLYLPEDDEDVRKKHVAALYNKCRTLCNQLVVKCVCVSCTAARKTKIIKHHTLI
jgi:hypothetical protein